ncbi:hypothetical protein F6X37_32395 [Paraburkholderia sp. 31.1]|uniref:hypothetical protein n=1 Tax=Paraburkholderia sp. 31.1 TaxID=2615205 RepID=UPI0016562787|nr:hypothetical protein [Paraburkholderia sp. 31.1]MBC8726069.1 hypothetical protein [Paraburkholderia sp. 31.1]
MTLTRTFPTDRAAGLPLADTRLLVAAMVESDTTGKPRAGVLPSHYNPLVTGTTGMAYQVAAFSAVTTRAGMGAELVANDGAATVATTAAPGANSRIDVIWVRSLFTTTGDAGTDPVFGVTQGTAAASPSKPSIPSGALELATAVILSTTTQTSTAVITQTHPYTAMEGGTVALRNQAEMDAWAPADGGVVYQIDAASTFLRVRGGWVMQFSPRSMVRTRQIGATNTFTNATATTDLPQSGDATALAGTFVKQSPLTKLIVQVAATVQLSSGSAQAGFIVVRIGVTDYDVGRMQFPAAINRQTITGILEITGVPAGSLPVKVRFRAASASAFELFTDDRVQYSIMEVAP